METLSTRNPNSKSLPEKIIQKGLSVGEKKIGQMTYIS